MGIKSFLLVLGLVAQEFSYSIDAHRIPRQASSGAVAQAGATSSEGSNEGTGIGAAAGIGGVGKSVGFGSFNADTRSNPFLPWGAFAGMNLGSGGRIGAGCSGLSCGAQLGDFVVATPQLLNIGRNFFNNQRRNGYYGDQHAYASSSKSNYDDYGGNPSYDGYYGDNGNPSYNYRQSFSGPGNGNFDPFQFVQQFQQQNGAPYFQGQQGVGDYARFGNGQYYGGASTSTFGSSNGGRPVFSSTSTHVDPDGRVTTIESGSDQPDRVSTGRIGDNKGGVRGVYASSGTNVDPDGKVTSYRGSGSF